MSDIFHPNVVTHFVSVGAKFKNRISHLSLCGQQNRNHDYYKSRSIIFHNSNRYTTTVVLCCMGMQFILRKCDRGERFGVNLFYTKFRNARQDMKDEKQTVVKYMYTA